MIKKGAPNFESTRHAIDALWTMGHRLSFLLAWTWIVIAHLVLVMLAVLALWALELSPATVAEAVRTMLHSKPAEWLTVAGLSAASVLAAYLWCLGRIHRWIGHWLSNLYFD